MAPEDVRGAFREKFRLDDLTVHESDDWTLSVRPGQPVLGSLVLSSRHLAFDLSQVPRGAGAPMLELMAQRRGRRQGALRRSAPQCALPDDAGPARALPSLAALRRASRVRRARCGRTRAGPALPISATTTLPVTSNSPRCAASTARAHGSDAPPERGVTGHARGRFTRSVSVVAHGDVVDDDGGRAPDPRLATCRARRRCRPRPGAPSVWRR